jgi:hypothetical protein
LVDEKIEKLVVGAEVEIKEKAADVEEKKEIVNEEKS